jgi:hypothetical protein
MKKKNKPDFSKTGKKGDVWISAILYIVIIVVAIALILTAGTPIINQMRDKISFTKARDTMLNLDNHIQDIASEGQGSQRIVPIEVGKGKLKIENNQIIWEIDTDSQIMSSRTKVDIGNLYITSNANVRATTYEAGENGSFILQTELGATETKSGDIFLVNISKLGNETNWVSIDTSSLINYISYKNNTLPGTFSFTLNDNATSAYGTGYTKLIPAGNNTNIGSAKVIAHINSDYAEYDLEITLDSYADFITTKIKNFIKN